MNLKETKKLGIKRDRKTLGILFSMKPKEHFLLE